MEENIIIYKQEHAMLFGGFGRGWGGVGANNMQKNMTCVCLSIYLGDLR